MTRKTFDTKVARQANAIYQAIPRSQEYESLFDCALYHVDEIRNNIGYEWFPQYGEKHINHEAHRQAFVRRMDEVFTQS